MIILNALNGKPLPGYGDGKNVRDWLYVTDHSSAIRRVAQAGKTGDACNVFGRNEMTSLEVVQALCSILDELRPREGGQSYGEQVHYVQDRPGHDRRYAIGASLIEHALGRFPAETLQAGIRKTEERRWSGV